MYWLCKITFFIVGTWTVLAWNEELIKDFAIDLVNSEHAVIFGCSRNDLAKASRILVKHNQYILPINLKDRFLLTNILNRNITAKACIILDATCLEHRKVLEEASTFLYFNKTYQWLITDDLNIGATNIFDSILNIGLNSQITYVNKTVEGAHLFYDVHSKGRHLNSSLEIQFFGQWTKHKGFEIIKRLEEVQGITTRKQFNRLMLRGVTVIDRDNITSNDIESLLNQPTKTDGVAPFIKYHYALVVILQDYLNFSVNYRVARGWAGRLRNSQYRLGLLGIVQRNEADIAASPSLNRLNRFSLFDTIHQSWQFRVGFLFRITGDLKVHSNRGGNFLAPFAPKVWILSMMSIFFIGLSWKIFIEVRNRLRIIDLDECQTYGWIFVALIAAVCQQGLDPAPRNIMSRTIALVLIIFSLLMYNFYTSSVVGGLLSNQAQGPQSISEIIDSPLIVSFEDIGYNKVLFKESNNTIVKKMYHEKLLPKRKPGMLPPFTQLNKAVPYLKSGSYAFHCELIDAYPKIARIFYPNEICDLRIVTGLLETGLVNMIVTKRSQYTETFKIVLHRAREVGLINRLLRRQRPEKPSCQLNSIVYPVTLNGVMSAFILLGGGMIMSILVVLLEIFFKKFYNKLLKN